MKKINNQHKCLDCDKLINITAIRCKSCNMKLFWKKGLLNTSHRKERFPLKSGEKYNNLTVVSFHHNELRNSVNYFYYLCRCDCGKEKVIVKDSIKNGDTKSCGCYHYIRCGEAHRKNKGEASFNGVYSLIKNGSIRRKIPFLLAKEQFKEISSKNCNYCGTEPNNKLKGQDKCYGRYNYNGIDRIDSNKPYVYENCVACCKYCNYAKNDMTLSEFLNHVKKIYEYNKK